MHFLLSQPLFLVLTTFLLLTNSLLTILASNFCTYLYTYRFAIMTDRLPPLQFENCDVIVKLSADHNRHLLVHSDVIRAGFPTLGPASKPQWNIPETIKHPLTGKQIDVYRLALKSVEHTILLEGKVCVFRLRIRES